MKSKTLHIAWILMLIVGIQRVGVSIMMFTMPDGNPDSGILYLLHAVVIIFITLGAYRKGELWSWFCLLLLGLTPPVYCLLAHEYSIYPVIGLLLYVPAALIPLKDFFGK